MARIRGHGNKGTEGALAKLLRKYRINGWRSQQVIRIDDKERRARRSRPTNIRTDFIFRRQRIAVFVDGCFWHGCPKHCSPLKWIRKSSMVERAKTTRSLDKLGMTGRGRRTGKEYWRAKLAGNKARDLAVNRMLRRHAWRVVRIWEHELGGDSSQKSEFRRQKVAGNVRSQKTGDSGQGTAVSGQKSGDRRPRAESLKAVERIRMILRRAQDRQPGCQKSEGAGKKRPSGTEDSGLGTTDYRLVTTDSGLSAKGGGADPDDSSINSG